MIIGSNFNYSSRKFLDDRQECESLEVLKSNPKGLLYPQGFEVYCIKEKQWYYNANENKDSIPVWKVRESNNNSEIQIQVNEIQEDLNETKNNINKNLESMVDSVIKTKFSNTKKVVTSLNLLDTTMFEGMTITDLMNNYDSGDIIIPIVENAFTIGQAYNTEVMFTDGTSYASGNFYFQFLKDSTVLFNRYTFDLIDLPNKAKLIFNKTNVLSECSDKTIEYIQVCKKASGENYPAYSKYTEDIIFDEIVTKSELNNLYTLSPFLYPRKVNFIGHRGGTSYPENSTLSFENGCKSGYDFIETDIWQTSDGELVCMHDQDVERTTDGTGDIMTMTLEEVKALTIDTDSNYTNLKVPTFKEYLLICKKYGKVPVIEIKNINQDWNKLASDLIDCNMQDSCIILCTSINFLNNIKQVLPKVHCSYLMYSESTITTTILESLQALGNASIDTNIAITEDIVKLCHSYGVLIGMWTIDNIANVDSYVDMGVDFITTNNNSVLYSNR